MRRFLLLDAMILVGATAVGLSVSIGLLDLSDPSASFSRKMLSASRIPSFHSPQPGARTDAFIVLGLGVIAFGSPAAAALGLVLIPLRLVSPRPRWRGLWRQPGLIACSTSTAGVAFLCWSMAVLCLIAPDRQIEIMLEPIAMTVVVSQIIIGMTVLVGWMILLIGGRWRAEPTWIDRLGRAIGVYWIASTLTIVPLLFI